LAALVQRYCAADDAASAASRLASFMHLLGGTGASVSHLVEKPAPPADSHRCRKDCYYADYDRHIDDSLDPSGANEHTQYDRSDQVKKPNN
jgi:hypothetical protein